MEKNMSDKEKLTECMNKIKDIVDEYGFIGCFSLISKDDSVSSILLHDHDDIETEMEDFFRLNNISNHYFKLTLQRIMNRFKNTVGGFDLNPSDQDQRDDQIDRYKDFLHATGKQ
jgi:hypothetical protein